MRKKTYNTYLGYMNFNGTSHRCIFFSFFTNIFQLGRLCSNISPINPIRCHYFNLIKK